MQFKAVIGQENIKQQLINEVALNKIPHAQLFVSRPGTGGLPLALAFAQYLNCDQRIDNDSCGVCPSCSKASQLVHPDIHYTFPVYRTKSEKPGYSNDFIKEWREANLKTPYQNLFDWLQFIKAGNKQGNISAEECRRVIKQLQLKSFEGKFKVQIIWMPETLGGEGNILLKLIEEPPADTILILVAEQQEKIINTILSRTQTKVLGDLQTSEIKARILSDHEVDKERANQIAFLADGNYHKALGLLQNTSDDLYDWLQLWLTASMNRQAGKLVEFSAQLHKQGREKVKQFFDYLLHFFRECLTFQFRSKEEVKLLLKEKGLAQKVWQFATLERITEVIAMIEKRYYHIERNVNAKHVLLDLSIRTEKILRGKPIPKGNQISTDSVYSN